LFGEGTETSAEGKILTGKEQAGFGVGLHQCDDLGFRLQAYVMDAPGTTTTVQPAYPINA
jgi:hypothetical protein